MRKTIVFGVLYVVGVLPVLGEIAATPYVVFYGKDLSNNFAAVIELKIENRGTDEFRFYRWSCSLEAGMIVEPTAISFQGRFCPSNTPIEVVLPPGGSVDFHTVLVSSEPITDQDIRISVALYRDHDHCWSLPIINMDRNRARSVLGDQLVATEHFQVYKHTNANK